MFEVWHRRDLPQDIGENVKVKNMEKLKLPIIRGFELEAKRLSMDDYLKFVEMHLKYTRNRDADRRWKKISAVNVAFSIYKDDR